MERSELTKLLVVLGALVCLSAVAVFAPQWAWAGLLAVGILGLAGLVATAAETSLSTAAIVGIVLGAIGLLLFAYILVLGALHTPG